MKRICFVGSGNIAEAILKGILVGKLFQPKNITMCDISADRLSELSRKYQVLTNNNNLLGIQNADVIVLAVKPQSIAKLWPELKRQIKPQQLVISIVAGVTLGRLAADSQFKLARVMPNTPALVGEAATAVCFNSQVEPEDKQLVLSIFKAMGLAIELPEAEINGVTALSGSGPAFVLRLLEAFIAAGKAVGLAEKDAAQLILQTFVGTAKLLSNSGKSIEELVQQVTSPQGTTAAGRAVLEQSAYRQIILDTVVAAKKRADELSQES